MEFYKHLEHGHVYMTEWVTMNNGSKSLALVRWNNFQNNWSGHIHDPEKTRQQLEAGVVIVSITKEEAIKIIGEDKFWKATEPYHPPPTEEQLKALELAKLFDIVVTVDWKKKTFTTKYPFRDIHRLPFLNVGFISMIVKAKFIDEGIERGEKLQLQRIKDVLEIKT